MIKENRNVIKGSPQLSFESNGKEITEWKIKGNSLGVGDKTANMFISNTWRQGYYANANGQYTYDTNWVCTPLIECQGGNTYSFSFDNKSRFYGFVWYDDSENYISYNALEELAQPVSFTATAPNNAKYLVVNVAGPVNRPNSIIPSDMENFMLNEGENSLPYEPYGYRIPISINNQIINLYIANQLYANDELTNNDLNIAFPTKYGRNILKVETNVIPKNVELITYTDSSLSDYNYNCKLNTRNEILRAWATKDNGAIVPKSWNHVQFLVKQGLHKDVFHIGDELVCKRGNDDIVWQVIGMDIDEPADPQYKHSMTLCMKNLLSETLPFSARQALFYFPDGLSAGTYYFTITQQSWVASDVNKSFYFTLISDIPKKGQIVLQNAYNVSCENKTLKTYSSSTSTTEIETATMYLWDDSIEATLLGNVNNSLQTNINCLQRAFLGNNNYKESHIRQWINGGEKATLVYQPQTVFDRPPGWNNTNVGLLKGMDNDFLKTVQSTKVKTARNTLTDGGRSDIIEDKFFLLSKPQVYGENTVENIDEGNVYPYFENYSSLSVASTGADKNRIKIKNGTAVWWWLRSPYMSDGRYIWSVSTFGGVGSSSATTASGIAAACNIFG